MVVWVAQLQSVTKQHDHRVSPVCKQLSLSLYVIVSHALIVSRFDVNHYAHQQPTQPQL